MRRRFGRAKPLPTARTFREIIERAENTEWLRDELLRYHDRFGPLGHENPQSSSPFEDYPQDVLKEMNRLVDALLAFNQRYPGLNERAQENPKTVYLALAREWDGLDLIDTQEKIVAARQVITLLTGNQ